MVSLRERCATHEAAHATAALALAIPTIAVSITDDRPHLHRGRYRAPHDCGLECLATLCLAGRAAKELFCGSIDDGGDQVDYQMAREYLAERFTPLQIGAALARQCPASCDYPLGEKCALSRSLAPCCSTAR